MVIELTLYSTDHCTLCERALELLFSMPELAGQSVRVVDVAMDDLLMDRFGERLPVLEVSAGGDGAQPNLLNWPFDADEVLAEISALNRA